MSLITLVIADNHAIFRQGLRSLIQRAPDCLIVAECGSGNEALHLIREHRPTVAILDISMPGLDGLSALLELRRSGDKTPIVILTTHDDPLMIERSRCYGANAYVNKEYAFEELLQTLRIVAQGTTLLMPPESNSVRIEREALTDREQEVLRLIVRGLSNRMIGETLGISIKTVDNHRANVMRKLDTHSTADLVRYAVKVGLG